MLLRCGFGGDGGLDDESIVIGGDGDREGGESSFFSRQIIKSTSQTHLISANGVCKRWHIGGGVIMQNVRT